MKLCGQPIAWLPHEGGSVPCTLELGHEGGCAWIGPSTRGVSKALYNVTPYPHLPQVVRECNDTRDDE